VVAEDRQLAVRQAGRWGRISPRTAKLAVAAAALLYAVAMLWPYLAATLVRGSAVTAWNNIATAPIRGRAPVKLPVPGSFVGADGVMVEIVNDLLDPAPMKVAEATLVAARARQAAAQGYLEGVQQIDRDRRELLRLHAANYRVERDAEIAMLQDRLAMLEGKLDVAKSIAARGRSVADSGYRSRDYRDDAQIRLAEAELALAAERMALERARRYRAAADHDIYLAPDGSSLNWAYGDRQDAKTEIKRAHLELDRAQAAEQEAERTFEAARQAFKLQHRAAVTAPPGATIRSLIIGAGAAVEPGHPVATWIDCKELYIDAPVSDAALPLIPIGSTAEAILEGEGRWRKAHVTNVRGAAETIGAADLAAVAKGRRSGDGQVLLRLEAERSEFGICPVGQAAYVHFPSAGLFAVLLARLGLRW
jgi:multidrug resistance efflux pump